MAPPTSRWMDMKLIEHRAEDRFSKVTFETNDHMINFGGTIQGGILTAMMDDAAGFNLFVSMGMKYAMASIDLNTQFYKSVSPGKLTVESRIVRAGKTIAFLEAKLYSADGELSAAMTSSVKLRPFGGLQYKTKEASHD